jgi:hypothetical protein
VTTPDRLAVLAAQEREAAAAAYRPPAQEDTRTHEAEVMASHPGRPTPAEAVGRGVTQASGGV